MATQADKITHASPQPGRPRPQAEMLPIIDLTNREGAEAIAQDASRPKKRATNRNSKMARHSQCVWAFGKWCTAYPKREWSGFYNRYVPSYKTVDEVTDEECKAMFIPRPDPQEPVRIPAPIPIFKAKEELK